MHLLTFSYEHFCEQQDDKGKTHGCQKKWNIFKIPNQVITRLSSKNPCDIHLKPVVLTTLDIGQHPAFKFGQFLF
jgi:hypothetical protein